MLTPHNSDNHKIFINLLVKQMKHYYSVITQGQIPTTRSDHETKRRAPKATKIEMGARSYKMHHTEHGNK